MAVTTTSGWMGYLGDQTSSTTNPFTDYDQTDSDTQKCVEWILDRLDMQMDYPAKKDDRERGGESQTIANLPKRKQIDQKKIDELLGVAIEEVILPK